VGGTAGREGDAIDGRGTVATPLDDRQQAGHRAPVAGTGRGEELGGIGGSQPGHGSPH
jgi:hypothetical protein